MIEAIRSICLFLLLLSLTMTGKSHADGSLPDSSQASPAKLQRILVLDTYQAGLPIPESIDRGIFAALREGGFSVGNVFMEHLDFNRNPGNLGWADTLDLLHHKFSGKRVDIVITIGAPATGFIARRGKGLFPDAAVLSLISPNYNTLSADYDKVMAIPWHVDPAGTLESALKLFPETRRVFVITGSDDSILPFLDEAKEAFARWQGKLEIEYSNEMTYDEMLQHIATLPPDAVIIYSPYFVDAAGQYFVPAEVVLKVRQSAKSPVFATLYEYLGSGITGGSLLKTEDIGWQAGNIALDYLNGRLKLNGAVKTFDTSPTAGYDWHELTHWKADLSELPEESIIINRPPTLWGQYANVVITVSVAFLALVVLIVGLTILNRRLKLAKERALESEARFRVMIESAPEAIIIYDFDQKRIVDANIKTEQLFGCSRGKLLQGGPDRFYTPNQPDGKAVAESVNDYMSRAMTGEELIFERFIHSDDGRDLVCEVRLVNLPHSGKRQLRGSFTDITKRKQLEAMLWNEKAFLRSVIDSADDLIYLKDRSSVYIGCNKAAEKFIGLAECEQIGKTDFDFFKKEQAEAIVKEDQRVFASDAPVRSEEWVSSQIAGKRLLDTVKAPIIGLDGQTIGLVGISRDITERKLMEKGLQESEERYRLLVNNLSAGLVIHAPDTSITFANPMASTLLGLTQEQIQGKVAMDPAWCFLREEGTILPLEEYPVNRVLLSGEPIVEPVLGIRRPDLIEPVWVQCYAYPVTDDGGQLVQVVVTFSDISEIKRAEKVLRKSEERHRTILQTAFDGIWRTDAQGRILEVNKTYCQMSGYSESELLTMHISDLEVNETAEGFSAHLLRTMKKGQEHFESRHRRKDGSLYDVEISAKYRKTEDGHFLIFIRDITERIKVEQEKADLENQLHQAQKIESIGQLAGGVAHDFNNMLSVILGHAEMALMKSDASSPLNSDLEEIITAAKRSADLTRKLLTFARKQVIAPEVLDLNETVSGMLNMLQRLIGENISLAWHPAANLWPVKFDRSQMDQILANLCVNARDAISGNGKITIHTENRTVNEGDNALTPELFPGDYVRLSICDDGCGMDEKTLAHVFEPFFTTKNVGAGTGLGLAMVLGAVKQNSGFIYIVSEPDQGAAVNIYLPRVKEKVAATTESAENTPGRGTETVLLVEDDEMLLSLETTMLAESGYTVLAAATPEVAVSLAREHPGPIHLLISDMIMPEMNGKELSEKLQPLRPEMKVLFLSGYTAEIISSHGIIQEGINFLQKPFSIEALNGKVRDTLDDHGQKDIR